MKTQVLNDTAADWIITTRIFCAGLEFKFSRAESGRKMIFHAHGTEGSSQQVSSIHYKITYFLFFSLRKTLAFKKQHVFATHGHKHLTERHSWY